MRIAFCGKGGSGKTSVASLFIKYLLSKEQSVLAIDGDINQHLGAALGIDAGTIAAHPKLGQRQSVMLNYIRGDNARIRKPEDMIESTPAGRGSRLVVRGGADPVTETFMMTRGTLRFMAVGSHEDHDVGATCFHKFTGAEGIFLNHYLDAADEYVVADMCAGADPFSSSGLATRFDASVVVLEPTLKSIDVFHQAKAYGEPHRVRILPVANKVMGRDDLDFIEQQIGQTCLASFGALDAIRAAEKGRDFDIAALDADTIAALDAIRHTVDALPQRDWAHYQELGNMFHRRASDSWASAMYGYDMASHIDPDFRYPDVAPLKKTA